MEPVGPRVVEAVVQVGDVTTSYLRCGRGASVVLLALDPVARLRLLAALSAGQRVIAPLPQATSAAAGSSLAAWVRGVLDGLGLQDAEILLAPDAAHLAPVLRAHCEERVHILRYDAPPGAGGPPAES